MLFSLLKHHLAINITDTALKVSRSLYCFTNSISHGVEHYFPRLWGTGISDAIFTHGIWMCGQVLKQAGGWVEKIAISVETLVGTLVWGRDVRNVLV